MIVLRQIVLVALGIVVLVFTVDAALDVEEAYASACVGRICPSIITEIYVLKLCAVATAVAVPGAIAWAIDRRRDQG